MRRALLGFGVLVVLAAVGIGVWPRQGGNTALAEVARAMENVKSVHITGFRNTLWWAGGHTSFEIWIKKPAKYREIIKTSSGIIRYDTADDGTKRVLLSTWPKCCVVTIWPSTCKQYHLLMPAKHAGLNWFSKKGMLEATLMGIVDSRSTTLPDGRRAQVIKLAYSTLDNDSGVVITIDKATNLLTQMEVICNGKVEMKTRSIEYNVNVPDSMFEIRIPKNAEVRDEFTKRVKVLLSPERQALKAGVSKQMAEEGGHWITSMGIGGSCGSPYHRGMRFYFDGPSASETTIWYVKSRNAFYIFGKALVTDSEKPGFRRVVEDEWFASPRKPDKLLGTLVMRIDKPGGYKRLITDDDKNAYAHDHWSFVERIQNIGDGPLILMHTEKITFYGKAKVLPQGKVYHNGQIVESFSDMRLNYGDEYDLAKADFGSLPDSEVAAMKIEIENHNKRARLFKRHRQDEESALERLPDDAAVVDRFDHGVKTQDHYFQSDPKIGMTLIYIPSRDSIYIVGRGRMVARQSYWRTERIVENEEVKAPSPDYGRYYREGQKQRKKNEEWRKQHHDG